mmetsp:Transcript_10581/g.15322  ORF Transcript_10581/g.15322 Transcript_10581/m.15322 type:complete len:87 (-) Transcript_10581:442-702(-)
MLSNLYNIKHLGGVRYFLSVRIERNRERREFFSTQEAHIRKFLRTYVHFWPESMRTAKLFPSRQAEPGPLYEENDCNQRNHLVSYP